MDRATAALRRIFWLALANTASALQYYLLAYVLSSYLGQYLPDAEIGLVWSASAALMILGFAVAPFVLARLSVRRVAVLLGLMNAGTLLLLALSPPSALAVALVIVQGALAPLMAYTLDLFLENATEDERATGHMRGLFLTAANVALVASPLLIGLILGTGNDYARIFIAAALSLVAFLVIITNRRRFFADETITHPASLFATLRCLLENREIRSVLIANTILQCFYVWAPVYVSLYLHAVLGWSWAALGPVFALMLLPFLLIELPLGFLEDRFRGARAVMATGFVAAGVGLMAFAFVDRSTSFFVIAVMLIVTRIGAALIEITAETSFFRDVGGQDAESVSFFRMTRPLGMLLGPLAGSALLTALTLQAAFLPLGLLTLLGIPFALYIKDASDHPASA